MFHRSMGGAFPPLKSQSYGPPDTLHILRFSSAGMEGGARPLSPPRSGAWFLFDPRDNF